MTRQQCAYLPQGINRQLAQLSMVQNFGKRAHGLFLALYKNEHRRTGLGSCHPDHLLTDGNGLRTGPAFLHSYCIVTDGFYRRGDCFL